MNDDRQIKYYAYLNQLQESGKTNMYGAAPYLRKQFPWLTIAEAMQVVRDWIAQYDKD